MGGQSALQRLLTGKFLLTLSIGNRSRKSYKKRDEEFFFFFLLFTFENDRNLFWVYQNGNFLLGKKHFTSGKNQGKWLCPQKNMPVTPLRSGINLEMVRTSFQLAGLNWSILKHSKLYFVKQVQQSMVCLYGSNISHLCSMLKDHLVYMASIHVLIKVCLFSCRSFYAFLFSFFLSITA